VTPATAWLRIGTIALTISVVAASLGVIAVGVGVHPVPVVVALGIAGLLVGLRLPTAARRRFDAAAALAQLRHALGVGELAPR
jgi:hypothetical protein